jgi:hypothetical protein
VAGKFVLLNGFADDLFRDTIGVDVGCDRGISNCSKWVGAVENVPVSQVVSPRSYAAFKRGSDSSSSMTQGCHLDEPMDMAPRMGTETLKPLFPRRLYSALDSLRRPSTSSLSGMIAYVSISWFSFGQGGSVKSIDG